MVTWQRSLIYCGIRSEKADYIGLIFFSTFKETFSIILVEKKKKKQKNGCSFWTLRIKISLKRKSPAPSLLAPLLMTLYSQSAPSQQYVSYCKCLSMCRWEAKSNLLKSHNSALQPDGHHPALDPNPAVVCRIRSPRGRFLSSGKQMGCCDVCANSRHLNVCVRMKGLIRA